MEVTIRIERLKLYARHGVTEQERRVGNLFEVTVSLTYPAPDEITDDISGTINYAEMADVIRHEMSIPSRLIEHVASRIRASMLHRFPQVVSGCVCVAKLTPPLGLPISSASAAINW